MEKQIDTPEKVKQRLEKAELKIQSRPVEPTVDIKPAVEGVLRNLSGKKINNQPTETTHHHGRLIPTNRRI